MNELAKKVSKEAANQDIRTKLGKIENVFFNQKISINLQSFYKTLILTLIFVISGKPKPSQRHGLTQSLLLYGKVLSKVALMTQKLTEDYKLALYCAKF
jgi:hypothetical protein